MYTVFTQMYETEPLEDARLSAVITQLNSAHPESAGMLIAQFYVELRRIARSWMSRERCDHTLQPTALVNELFMRMQDEELVVCDRSHFLAVATTVMRRILVDHARIHSAAKRWSGAKKVPLENVVIAYQDQKSAEVLALNEALDRMGPGLERERKSLELQYFLGMELEEIAEQLGVCVSTVKNDLRFAKHFLRNEMSKAPKCTTRS